MVRGVRAAAWPLALLVSSCAAIAQLDGDSEGGPTRARRRELIQFAPAPESEQRFACTLSGELKVPFWGSHGMDGTWTMTRKVLEVDADGDQIRASMTFDSGTCKVAGTTATIAKQPPLMCIYDTRHRLLQMDPTDIPPDTHGMDGDDIITLSGILVLLCETVPYHVRSAKVGTEWVDDYECRDVNDRRVRVSGTSRLVAFVDDVDRRVGVIESRLQIPVTGSVAGAHLIGRLECRVLSEVYVDDGHLRYRDMLAEGTLAAGTANVDVDDLHTTLAVMSAEGTAAKPLYAAPAGTRGD